MKAILFFFLFTMNAYATFLASCGPGLIRQWIPARGYTCVSNMMVRPEIIQGCFGPVQPFPTNPFAHFPAPLYQPAVQPWWAYQGNLHYPNLHYPGPWAHPGIQQHHYPGQGQVFAAKPNVYLDSIHKDQKFSFRFLSDKPQFLATTPFLEKNNSWKGELDHDKFEVDGIFYDYLFYDIRFPKEKMQFIRGLCSTREGAIQWMMEDLKKMKYSMISLQDFEEHWRVKIPDYPYYCIYPQYNAQLDPILPIEITVDQSRLIRSLYVLVPHRKEPDAEEPQEIPFPIDDPAYFRPDAKIKREVEFREWGVAFLGY